MIFSSAPEFLAGQTGELFVSQSQSVMTGGGDWVFNVKTARQVFKEHEKSRKHDATKGTWSDCLVTDPPK